MPAVTALFRNGDIDYRIVSVIINRTANVRDEHWPTLDAVIAATAGRWRRLTVPKLRDRVDALIARHDPDAVRVPPKEQDNRYVDIRPTTPGKAGIWASVNALDGAAFDQRLDAISTTVCENDPRTHEQRRADAIGALGRGHDVLECQCGLQDCPAQVEQQKATDVVIHLLAHQSTLDGTSNEPGYLVGFGIQPADTIRDTTTAARVNVKVRPVTVPEATTQPEPRYRPSAGLTDFLRWRDMTCAWPGCDKPAQRCDVDHTEPYPAGPTHPSNTKHFCRLHHLVKTYCKGWMDRQTTNGTVTFTAPTGHVYQTEPHGATLFPLLGQSTGELDIPGTRTPNSGAMMPKRRQTREHDQQDRIDTERRQRHALNEQLAEEQRRHQQWLTDNSEPPPF